MDSHIIISSANCYNNDTREKKNKQDNTTQVCTLGKQAVFSEITVSVNK